MIRALPIAAALGLAAIGGLAAKPQFSARIAMPEAANEPLMRRAGKRESAKTLAGRRIGRAADPFFEIKSKGRRGALDRAARMAAAHASARPFRGSPVGRVFLSDKREETFISLLGSGIGRNAALRAARRVAA